MSSQLSFEFMGRDKKETSRSQASLVENKIFIAETVHRIMMAHLDNEIYIDPGYQLKLDRVK